MQQYHPVIDERALIPKEVNVMQRVFGIASDIDLLSRDCLLDPWMSNYTNLQGAFFNMDDACRSFIGSNFPQIDELVENYLVYKGIIDKPQPVVSQTQSVDSGTRPTSGATTSRQETQSRKQLQKGLNFTSEYLLATVEILSFKIEAAHLQRVLMGWLSGQGVIPATTELYTHLMRKY